MYESFVIRWILFKRKSRELKILSGTAPESGAAPASGEEELSKKTTEPIDDRANTKTLSVFSDSLYYY